MEQQVKSDWIINNENIFGLQQKINLGIFCIQSEMLNQVEENEIKSISEYFNCEIDVTKEIRLTNGLTINKVFSNFFDFDNILPNGMSKISCYLILRYLQGVLFREYSKNKHKTIFTFSEYQTQYYSILNGFIASNIDTDRQDFIESEQIVCDNLIKELNKPIYNEIDISKTVLNKPCRFKNSLLNSIDKRKKFLDQQANEKQPKVKALFQFIEFLYSNIENFNQFNNLIKEIEKLITIRDGLNTNSNYLVKDQRSKIQEELKIKFKPIQDEIAKPIKSKALELNICKFNNSLVIYFNNVEKEINDLKSNFTDEDLPEIFQRKNQYLKFRTETHKTFLTLQSFFSELDDLLKSLFDYFPENPMDNNFPNSESNVIEVSSINEAIARSRYGQSNFILGNDLKAPLFFNQQGLTTFNFFQIDVREDLEFAGTTYKNIRQRNNDSILTPENWEQHKEMFFTQRMATYQDSYTLAEKIKQELSILKKLPSNKPDYQILIDRYKVFLKQEKALPPQQTKKQKHDPKETELSEKIKEHFGFFNRNCPRKHKQILNDTDFEKLIKWTIWFFENELKAPEISEPIKVVNTNKTFVQLAFKYLFKEFYKNSPYPETLFEFYQSAFTPYSMDNKGNFLAVKNNVEVKKLMKIKY